MAISPDFETFAKHFADRKTQVVYQWLPADLETPVAAYLKLCHNDRFSFLLESVEGGAVLGRYSAIGFDPDLLWRSQGHGVETQITRNGQWNKDSLSVLKSLQSHLEESRIDVETPGLPPMARSGLFGFMGYGMIRHVEDIPDENPDTLEIPDSLLMRPTVMVIFDNVKQMMCIAVPVRVHAGYGDAGPEAVYEYCAKRLHDVHSRVTGPVPKEALSDISDLAPSLSANSNMTRETYHEIVEKAVDYINAGDIFQVVPSQRFSAPFDLPPIALYRSLRRLNPSPFLFHLKFDDFALVGSSPEILVRVRDETVTIRPIAGTRKRGRTAAEDKALADELLGDEKECAEHLMLLDLGRNDVGRVAATGSVSVTDQFAIEYYSHVMHIVSNVEGRLAHNQSPLDALFSGFPAGTVSGAPKIRAMEIIDELEPVRRSFYGGCVGYLDADGDIDTCIALRTALVKDGQLYVQAGGGVVADSDPEAEYQESCNKARALIEAASQAIEQSQTKTRD